MVLPKKVLLALLPYVLAINAQVSGSGTTTRYWDCCKASCGWTGKASLAAGSSPVKSCDRNDNFISDMDTKSGCQGGGSAFMCTNQSPWAVSDSLAYGFAATTISGGNEASWCCACYELTFTSGPVAGKKLVVQATNTGGDLGSNQFDLAMPGGGFGIFDGCTSEFGTPSTGWGAQYGGISSRSQCDNFAPSLKAGCYWRFDWFQNADNPKVTFKQVTCPKALTDKSGCIRAGEVPTGGTPVPTYSGGASSSTSTSTSTSKTSTSVPASPSTSTVKTSTSTVKTSTSTGSTPTPPVTGGADLYGQCGGLGFSGPTTCKTGKCTFSNQWYSQCLP